MNMASWSSCNLSKLLVASPIQKMVWKLCWRSYANGDTCRKQCGPFICCTSVGEHFHVYMSNCCICTWLKFQRKLWLRMYFVCVCSTNLIPLQMGHGISSVFLSKRIHCRICRQLCAKKQGLPDKPIIACELGGRLSSFMPTFLRKSCKAVAVIFHWRPCGYMRILQMSNTWL